MTENVIPYCDVYGRLETIAGTLVTLVEGVWAALRVRERQRGHCRSASI